MTKKDAANQSKWHDKEVATGFLEGIRGAIPAAQMQLELIDHIIRSWNPHPKSILDLGCGDGTIGRFLLKKIPDTHLLFVDFSDPMLDAVKKQVGSNERTTIIKADFSTPAWLEAVSAQKPIDVVVSGYAIHHQPDKRKKELYTEIYTLLNEGGIFLNLEHVESPTSDIESLFENCFIDHLYQFHKTTEPEKSREEIARAFYHRPDKGENILAPVQLQCNWLQHIGFKDVDCFFKFFELALFGGRK